MSKVTFLELLITCGICSLIALVISLKGKPIMTDDKYQTGQIMSDKRKEIKCCRHKNLVPLEIGIASKTWPNGYKAEPNYNFAISLMGANIIRVKSYICLDCRMEIKAPEPGSLKKDRL